MIDSAWHCCYGEADFLGSRSDSYARKASRLPITQFAWRNQHSELVVVVIFSKRVQKGRQGRDIALADRHILEFGR